LVAKIENGLLKIELTNTCAEVEVEQKGLGQALANTRARLEAYFEKTCRFDVGRQANYFVVQMELEL
jgi:hypothetical protein